MKKIILFLHIFALFLAGCTANTQTDSTGNTQPAAESTEADSIKVSETLKETANSGFTQREFTFESAGNKIYARALVPNTTKKVPLVILSHGFGGNHEQVETTQEDLADGNIAVFSFDFAGGSRYSDGKSEGSNLEMSVLTEVTNLKEAVEFAKKLDFVDTQKIYLMGTSQGGVVSGLVASDMQDDIAGLYLLYPAFSLFDDARQRFPSKEDIQDTNNLMGITVGKNYFLDVYDIDIYDTIKNINTKTHIFHGTSDNIVPYSYSQTAATTFPNATLTTLEGVGHGFNQDTQKQVAKIILSEISTAQISETINMQIDNTPIEVEWENNKTVEELKKDIKEKELNIQLSRYSDFEQVGELGKSYTSTDSRITAESGDIVLYSGNKIVIFYGTNTWSYTKLGKITNLSKEQLTQLLESKDVTLKLN